MSDATEELKSDYERVRSVFTYMPAYDDLTEEQRAAHMASFDRLQRDRVHIEDILAGKHQAELAVSIIVGIAPVSVPALNEPAPRCQDNGLPFSLSLSALQAYSTGTYTGTEGNIYVVDLDEPRQHLLPVSMFAEGGKRNVADVGLDAFEYIRDVEAAAYVIVKDSKWFKILKSRYDFSPGYKTPFASEARTEPRDIDEDGLPVSMSIDQMLTCATGVYGDVLILVQEADSPAGEATRHLKLSHDKRRFNMRELLRMHNLTDEAEQLARFVISRTGQRLRILKSVHGHLGTVVDYTLTIAPSAQRRPKRQGE